MGLCSMALVPRCVHCAAALVRVPEPLFPPDPAAPARPRFADFRVVWRCPECEPARSLGL